jgi:predicted nucleotide-binding protein
MTLKDKAKPDINIFISYASEDSGHAAKLIQGLAKQPNLHLFTSNKISAGENWQSRIKKELSKSDFFLVLLSPTSVDSKWVQFELGAAWGLNKFIIPIVTNHEVVKRIPLDLARLHVIEIDQLKTSDTLTELIEEYEKTAA